MEINFRHVLFPVIWVANNLMDSSDTFFSLYMEHSWKQEEIVMWILTAMTSAGLPEAMGMRFLPPLKNSPPVQTDPGMDLKQKSLGKRRLWWLDCWEVAVHASDQENLAMKFYIQDMLNVVSAICLCKWHGMYAHKTEECAEHPSLGILRDKLCTVFLVRMKWTDHQISLLES